MENTSIVTSAIEEVNGFFAQPTAYRSVLIFIAAIIVSYIASRFLAKGIIKIAQRISTRSDNISDSAKLIRMRQTETYLSISIAIVRAAIVAVVAYGAWRVISPASTSGAAAIGASAFFIVIAGQTIGTVLRDITMGVVMITEQWFNVGDFVKIEPFLDVEGVVERFTLRSTKLRGLNGEVVNIHNQHIQAARVTPNSVRTLSVDLFTRHKADATKHIEQLSTTIPTGALMLADKLRIQAIEEWGEGLWRIKVLGKTAPGREWLIEKFFVNAIIDLDEDVSRDKRIFEYEPIVAYADPAAERRFKKAVRTN